MKIKLLFLAIGVVLGVNAGLIMGANNPTIKGVCAKLYTLSGDDKSQLCTQLNLHRVIGDCAGQSFLSPDPYAY